jgi:uncharacterized membrane protein
MPIFPHGQKHYRSLAKEVSWRLTGGLDTLVITFFVTGKLKWASYVSGVELFTKIFLYYVHERVWHKIAWGKLRSGRFKKSESSKSFFHVIKG